MLPEIKKTYSYFDDGKICEARHYDVKIIELIPFTKIDEETRSVWLNEVKNRDWLYSQETDYFVKAKITENEENIMFVRTLDQGWFSLGWWAGRLDVDGKLYKTIKTSK